MPSKIAYLGPKGTFSEQAVIKFNPTAMRIAHNTCQDVFDAVDQQRADLGVLAIENMIQGMVRDNFDLLYESSLKVQAEIVLPIEHALVAAPDHKQIEQIFAHTQALAQCRDFLRNNYPTAELIPATSNTAGMFRIIQENLDHAAAIGPLHAAGQYKLIVLQKNIEDMAGNVTRFWVVGRELITHADHDKISLAYHFAKDKPGSLYRSLGCFADQKINLISLEVRPSKRELGNYVFHVDLDANLAEQRVRFALDDLERITDRLLLIGSYQKATL